MADKNILVLCYSRCTTCKRALKWLDEHGVSYTLRDIKEENPTAEELAEWHKLSGLAIRKFLNTSGMVYRDNNIKEQLDAGMSDSDAYNLLATTGMLVKRPLVVAGNTILLGFKEPVWEETLL